MRLGCLTGADHRKARKKHTTASVQARALSSLRGDRVDERLQPREMRSRPVDLLAALAAKEAVVLHPRVQGKPLFDEAARNRSNRSVALEAAREGCESSPEVERVDDLEELAVRLHLAHEVAMGHRPSLEKAPVAGEHDSSLVAGARGDAGVVELALVDGVEADEPQIPGELSQMHVRDELRLAQRLGTKTGEARGVPAPGRGGDGGPPPP